MMDTNTLREGIQEQLDFINTNSGTNLQANIINGDITIDGKFSSILLSEEETEFHIKRTVRPLFEKNVYNTDVFWEISTLMQIINMVQLMVSFKNSEIDNDWLNQPPVGEG